MKHAVRIVAAVAVLTALALCVPVQAQTPKIDALRARAEEGVASAQNDLGVRYANGDGVPEDDAEAVRWYRLAADQGLAQAQYILGRRYDLGVGFPQDYVEALRWFRLAAEQGHAEAQYNLGYAYNNGEGVPQDDVQAHMWFDLAASRRLTGEFAVRNRDRVAGLMNSTQIAEAQRLAREWDVAHPREP